MQIYDDSGPGERQIQNVKCYAKNKPGAGLQSNTVQFVTFLTIEPCSKNGLTVLLPHRREAVTLPEKQC